MSDGVTFFCNICRRHGSIKQCVQCDDIYCSTCNEPPSATCQHGHLRNIRPITRRLDMLVCKECGGTGGISRGVLETKCEQCKGIGATVEVI